MTTYAIDLSVTVSIDASNPEDAIAEAIAAVEGGNVTVYSTDAIERATESGWETVPLGD